MALTSVNCDLYRSEEAGLDTCSYVALNAALRPGTFIVAAAYAARNSLGSQIACRLSLEHFVEGCLDFYHEPRDVQLSRLREGVELGQVVLESAFRRANSSVYEFGHKLAAGGRMSSAMLGVVVDNSSVSVARVGTWSSYLFRGSTLYPFFEDTPLTENPTPSYVGSQSMITIETASVPIEERDKIFLFSSLLDGKKEGVLGALAREIDPGRPQACADLSKDLFSPSEQLSFVMAASIGPETIYLEQPVE